MHLKCIQQQFVYKNQDNKHHQRKRALWNIKKLKMHNKMLNLTSTVSSADPNFSKLTKGYRDTNVTAGN